MIRAVLDTNVILSALRSRNGASFEIVTRYRRGEFDLHLSQTVFAEYEEVLKREMMPLGFAAAIIDRFLNAIASAATQIRTSSLWKPSLPDPDDEPLAQLAMESKIDYYGYPQSAAPSLVRDCRQLAWLIQRLFWTYCVSRHNHDHCQHPRFSGPHPDGRGQKRAHIG